MTTSQKQRKSAYSSFEKAFLSELVAEVAHIIESKKTDTDFAKKKQEYWAKITEKFNCNPNCQEATSQQLKKLWLNMKLRARDAKTIEKQRNHTGGGPYIPDMSQENESIISIIPHILPTIKVHHDSDGPADIDGDDDDESWLHKKNRWTKKFDEPLEVCDVPEPVEVIDVHDYVKLYPTQTNFSSNIRSTIPDKTTHTITSCNKTCPATQLATTSSASTIPHTFPSATYVEQTIPLDTSKVKTTKSPKPQVTQNKKQYAISAVDKLKIELIKNDIVQRKIKFERQSEHQNRMNELEYEHTQKMYKLLEAEQAAKLEKAKTRNNDCE